MATVWTAVWYQSGCHVRPYPDDPGDRKAPPVVGTRIGRALYRFSLLVYVVDQLRQSGDYGGS